ncbi:hypothetical protein D3C71_1453190 [compost metagenome]
MQLATLAQGVHRGAVGHAEGRSGGEVHARRDRQNVIERHRHLLGERTPAGERHDPVADLERAGLFANGGHHACCLATWRERQRWLELVFAFDDQGVGEIDTGGLHIQQDLVFPGLRAGHVFQYQVARRTQGFAQHSFHRGYSFAGSGR